MSNNKIDAAGTILSAMNNGFTINDCLNEKTDNAIDWGATEILDIINTQTRECLFIDNGEGMDIAGLDKMATINKHTKATDTKSGCFGYGTKASSINSTNLESDSTFISSRGTYDARGNLNIYSNKLDWKRYIEHNIYDPNPHDASRYDADLFEEVMKNLKSTKGTVIREIYGEESFLKKTENITQYELGENMELNILIGMGIRYNIDLSKGLNIKFHLDNTRTYTVLPIDNVKYYSDEIPDKYKEKWLFYADNSEVGFLRIENKTYRIKRSGAIQEIAEFPEFDDNNSVQILLTYATPEYWLHQHNTIMEQLFASNPIPHTTVNLKGTVKESKDAIKVLNSSSGNYYIRSNKCIFHEYSTQKTDGDFEDRKVFRDSHLQIQIPAIYDSLFGVQINKSALKPCTIIKKAIKYAKSEFVQKIIKLLKEPTVAVEEPVATQEPTVAVATQEPTVAVAVVEEPTVAVATQEPTVAVTTQEPTVAVTTQEPTVAVTTQEPTVAVVIAEEPNTTVAVVIAEEPNTTVAVGIPSATEGPNTTVAVVEAPTRHTRIVSEHPRTVYTYTNILMITYLQQLLEVPYSDDIRDKLINAKLLHYGIGGNKMAQMMERETPIGSIIRGLIYYYGHTEPTASNVARQSIHHIYLEYIEKQQQGNV